MGSDETQAAVVAGLANTGVSIVGSAEIQVSIISASANTIIISVGSVVAGSSKAIADVKRNIMICRRENITIIRTAAVLQHVG